MRKYVSPLFLGSLFIWGCSANPATDSRKPSGTGGVTQGNGGATSNGGTAPTGGVGGPGNGGAAPNGGANPGAGAGGMSGGTGPVGQGGGTAGTSPNGGAPTNGGTAGTPTTGGSGGGEECVPDLENLVNPSGWVCAKDTPIAIQGAWYPYGDGTSCTPDPETVCATGSCCISGATVDPGTDFTNWGCGLGFELNSSGGDNAIKAAYTGAAKCFDIELTGSSGLNPVRIGFTQAVDTDGQITPFVEIPPFTDGWTGQLCFTDAECPDWAVEAGTCTKKVGSEGTPHDLQIQISAVDAASASEFNVCVSKLKPVVEGNTGGTTNSCSSVTGQGSISDQFGTAHVTCNGKDYIVQNNAWGSTAGQTITFGPGTKFKVAQQNGTGANGAPASYPSIFIGANSGRFTDNSGLPKAVSSIMAGGVPTALTWQANGAQGDYNVSYDVWFSTGAGGDPDDHVPSGGFLMVWFYDPPGAQPIGTLVQQNGTANIAGRNWSVWYGNNSQNGKPCVSYVAQQTVNSLEFKLGDFIRDAVTRGYVQDSWYLTNVFAGFEIWNGGTGVEITDFFVEP